MPTEDESAEANAAKAKDLYLQDSNNIRARQEAGKVDPKLVGDIKKHQRDGRWDGGQQGGRRGGRADRN